MRTLSFLLLILATASCAAQPWLTTIQVGGPGEEFPAMIDAVDGDGSFYVHGNYSRQVGPLPAPTFCLVGTDTLLGTEDAFIAKYTSAGALVWLRNCVSSNGSVYVMDMAYDSLSAALFVVGGYSGNCMLDTVQPGSGGSFISKWNSAGHCLWAKTVASGSELTSCTVGPNGSLLVSGRVGNTFGTVEGQWWQQGAFLLAYTAQGDTLWTRYLNTHDDFNELAYPIHLISSADGITALLHTGLREDNDTLVIDGLVQTGYHGAAYGILRADPGDGHVLWVRTDGSPTSLSSAYVPDQMVVLNNGDILLARYFGDTAIIDGDTLLSTAEASAALIRYSNNGSFLSVQQFTATETVGFQAISEAPGGQFLVTGQVRGDCTWNGHSLSTGGEKHVLLCRLDSDGTCLALSSFGVGIGVSIQSLPSGFALTGQFGVYNPAPGPPLNMGPISFTSEGWDDSFIAVHDGSVGVSSQHAPEETGLQIYANPNNGSFRLVLPEAIAHAPQVQLRLYDSTGQLVKEQTLGSEERRPRMDIFDVGAGLYVVTVSDGQRTYSGSMVVE
jgi:hypothetical protein